MSRAVFIEPSYHPERHVVLDSLIESGAGELLPEQTDPEAGSVVLGYIDGVLSVRWQGSKDKPVFVDFVGGKSGHRRKFGGGKGQDIAKAVGLNKGAKPSVLDATGGLGRDAFVLASLGCSVTLIERSPVIAALLQDGLNRAREHSDTADIAGRMSLIKGDSQTVMEAKASENQLVDVVFLDPMFPHRDKSALVKKEMRLFQDLLGSDPDADELLEPALRLAEYRVVIKRPKGAPDLNHQEPTYRLTGKACRYDIHALKAF